MQTPFPYPPGSSAPVYTSEVRVSSASDLSGDLQSDVLYRIDGIIDMGSTQIKVPNDGLYLRGFESGVSGLVSSQNSYKMFINPDVGHAGNLFLRDLKITVGGTGSQVFDLDNQEQGGAFEMKDFNFEFCTSIGEVANYRQGLWDDFGLIGCVDGLTVSGTWAGGFAILTSILVSAGTAFTGTVLKAGAALIANGSIRSDMNALQLDSTGTFCDFAPANITNDAEFRMIGLRVNAASNAFPNMPASDVKARFASCVGTPNTYVGGKWTVTGTATTVIPGANTPVKLAGTTTYGDMQWFDNTVNNAFVYIGSNNIDVLFDATVPVSAGAGDTVNMILRHWDDSASSYVDLNESGPVTPSLFGNEVSLSAKDTVMLEQNDRLEVWIENQSDASNITTELGGSVIVSER